MKICDLEQEVGRDLSAAQNVLQQPKEQSKEGSQKNFGEWGAEIMS